ncbi:MAG: hypothetical protein K0B81_02895 [Candidatus Cloacimonetes bacterium]|nr:hypothetical protein [Candidatus Cloacimonadota bacterium]
MLVKFFIDQYRFGSIVINNIEYYADLIITPQKIITDWWRKESHILLLEDLQEIDWNNILSVFIGTGTSGLMQVDLLLQEFLEKKNIPFIIKPTQIAVKEYNRLINGMKIGIFHLTC